MASDTRISSIRGTGIPVRGNDIDTDRIIPARYLRAVTFDGLGPHAFEDDRKAADGSHPFDDPRYRGAQILVANRNFGSGSSREHAPQALLRWGIRAIVGESFAEIFFGNCYTLGIVCAVVGANKASSIQAAVEAQPTMELVVAVNECSVRAKDQCWSFMMPDSVREGFMTGKWDAIGELLENASEVRAVHNKLPYISGFTGE